MTIDICKGLRGFLKDLCINIVLLSIKGVPLQAESLLSLLSLVSDAGLRYFGSLSKIGRYEQVFDIGSSSHDDCHEPAGSDGALR